MGFSSRRITLMIHFLSSVCLFHVPSGCTPLRLLGGEAESLTLAPQCQIIAFSFFLTFNVSFALWLLSRWLSQINEVVSNCCHRRWPHVTKFQICCILMSIDCDSYGCDKLTTHCTKQRAALGSPNIQRNSSHPAETQTCFVSSAVLANLFESTHLYNLIFKKPLKPVACTASVYLWG